MSERNEQARKELDSELAELGLTPAPATNPKKQEEAKEEKPEQKQEEEKEQKPRERTERKAKDEDEEEETEHQPRPKKYKPLPEYLAEKQTWKEREKELLDEIESIKTSKKSDTRKDDDIDAEIKAFAEESGIEDPTSVKKLLALAKKATSEELTALKEELQSLKKEKELEKEGKKSTDEAEKLKKEQEYFTNEWKQFEPELKEAFEGLTKEQIEEAKVVMDEISHTKEWSKYDLSYIFYKNRKEFEEAIGTKKFKGSGQGKTQGITKPKSDDERPRLSENPTPEEIKAYDA